MKICSIFICLCVPFFSFCQETCLEILQIGEPLLRKRAKEISREEILGSEVQTLIEMMKATMRAAPGVGLAAPQIGKSIQLAIVEDVDHRHLSAKQLMERNRYPVPFHVLINPRLSVEENTPDVEFFEGCLSVPELIGVVPRAEAVVVEYFDEHGEPKMIRAKGWYARILQHEIDHLDGILYIDRALPSTLMAERAYIKLWQEKSVQEIQAELKVNHS